MKGAAVLSRGQYGTWLVDVKLGRNHMVDPRILRLLGRSTFHDTVLTSSGDLRYLSVFTRLAFAGYQGNIQMDISAEKMDIFRWICVFRHRHTLYPLSSGITGHTKKNIVGISGRAERRIDGGIEVTIVR